ncbi:hypothetical protein ABE82_26460 (plasmid) [Paenibacillus peoriae]|uniref:hypothetical protein n=1 Tax=Paenibacillus peoriae TaxID=59893 RepID=UPI00071ECA6C|nr:hypothetical protein [Paenibacillus peoriae]ALS09958.1 hypothetical protein ABE82_26460 [Paenibacillus peoriae]
MSKNAKNDRTGEYQTLANQRAGVSGIGVQEDCVEDLLTAMHFELGLILLRFSLRGPRGSPYDAPWPHKPLSCCLGHHICYTINHRFLAGKSDKHEEEDYSKIQSGTQ